MSITTWVLLHMFSIDTSISKSVIFYWWNYAFKESIPQVTELLIEADLKMSFSSKQCFLILCILTATWSWHHNNYSIAAP